MSAVRKEFTMVLTAKRAALSAVIVAAGVMFAACGKKEAQETTAAPAAQETTAAESTAPALTISLNYDYADLMNNDRDSMVKLLGEPESEETDETGETAVCTYDGGAKKILMYVDDEELNPGREGMVWLIQAKAGDLLTFSGEPADAAEFFRALIDEDAPELKDAEPVEGYAFADGKKAYSFELEGYPMQIVPGEDGKVTADSDAVIYMPVEKEEPEPEEEEKEEE